MLRIAMLAAALTACHPLISTGYDTTTRVHGQLANMMGQQPETTGYAVAIGAGTRNSSVELGMHAHDLSASSFGMATEGATAQSRYSATTTSLDLRQTLLRVGGASADVHFGPSEELVVDRMTGNRMWGSGVLYGGGLAYTISFVTAFVDAYRAPVMFSSGPARGNSDLSGLTVGLVLRK